MSRVTKVVLWMIGGLIGLVLIAAGVGGYLVHRYGDEALEAGKRYLAEGEALGRQTDNAGCVREALSRQKQWDSLSATIANGVFLSGCLNTSQATPGFCDDVPPSSEILNTARWAVEQCDQAGMDGEGCPNLFHVVQRHCEHPSGTPRRDGRP